jgi:hypothetical protein
LLPAAPAAGVAGAESWVEEDMLCRRVVMLLRIFWHRWGIFPRLPFCYWGAKCGCPWCVMPEFMEEERRRAL